MFKCKVCGKEETGPDARRQFNLCKTCYWDRSCDNCGVELPYSRAEQMCDKCCVHCKACNKT